jgi:hypothetical protein
MHTAAPSDLEESADVKKGNYQAELMHRHLNLGLPMPVYNDTLSPDGLWLSEVKTQLEDEDGDALHARSTFGQSSSRIHARQMACAQFLGLPFDHPPAAIWKDEEKVQIFGAGDIQVRWTNKFKERLLGIFCERTDRDVVNNSGLVTNSEAFVYDSVRTREFVPFDWPWRDTPKAFSSDRALASPNDSVSLLAKRFNSVRTARVYTDLLAELATAPALAGLSTINGAGEICQGGFARVLYLVQNMPKTQRTIEASYVLGTTASVLLRIQDTTRHAYQQKLATDIASHDARGDTGKAPSFQIRGRRRGV